MATKYKLNYELKGDSSVPVTRTECIKHGTSMLNSVIDNLSNYVTPQMFGAKGNGTSDDTSAIQAAVNSGRYVFIPEGTYKITSTIEIKGVEIHGENADKTIIKLYGCDGFKLKPTGRQRPVTISNISFIGTTNYYNIAGIAYEEQNTEARSRCYNITDCYFENLGCAVSICDAFRVNIERLNINDCACALYIYGQVVQLSAYSVTSNCDIADFTNYTKYGSIGCYITTSTHNNNTPYQPESIKLNQCSFVNHPKNLRINGCLYPTFTNCDIDLARVCAIEVLGIDGVCSFSGCWINSRNPDNTPVVKVHNMVSGKINQVVFDACSVSTSDVTATNKVGIGLGYQNEGDWFYEGLVVTNCHIYGQATPLKYGIFASRARKIVIMGNSIEASEYGIWDEFDENGKILNNKSTVYISNNSPHYTVCTGNTSQTLAGNGDYYTDYKRKNDYIEERYQYIESGNELTIVHDCGLHFNNMLVRVYEEKDDSFIPTNNYSIKELDVNAIIFKNTSEETKLFKVLISPLHN